MKYLLLFLLSCSVAYAAGPDRIATYDRSLWPEALDSAGAFDRASRFAIYQFLTAMEQVDTSNKEALSAFTGVKEPDLASVHRWKALTMNRLLANYRASCASLTGTSRDQCRAVDSAPAIQQAMAPVYAGLGAAYDAWKEKSAQFHQRYVYEQFRLAALFPRITSEILKLDDHEYDGFGLKDKQFLLTFDDGPSKNDLTGKLLRRLRDLHMNGIFFVLGSNLATVDRNMAKVMYGGQCVSSHGYVHKPHPKYAQWQASLDNSVHLVADTFAEPTQTILFRPPYGQRNDVIIDYLKRTYGSRVMLWNIDSQDWNHHLSAKQATDRVLTLMLLWRRGILLFHDVHPKALEAVPVLHDTAAAAGLTFVDCHSIVGSE